jgi:hypothetical protein
VKEVEQIVYQTMIRDTAATVGLLALLGTNVTPTPPATIDTSRILHSFQVSTPSAPGITFGVFSSPKGQLPRNTREVYIAFNIFAANYTDVAFRLMRLFDGVQHEPLDHIGRCDSDRRTIVCLRFRGAGRLRRVARSSKKGLRFRFFCGDETPGSTIGG